MDSKLPATGTAELLDLLVTENGLPLCFLAYYTDSQIVTETFATPSVSNLRPSRRHERGGAAQSRMALRAVVQTSCSKMTASPSAMSSPLPFGHVRQGQSFFHFADVQKLRSQQTFRQGVPSDTPFPTFPELSNSGSLSSRAGGFIWY